MNGHPDRLLHERIAAYALGAMDPTEHAEFQRELDAHLALGCAECARALAQDESAVVDLARSAPAARPSVALRARVMATIRQDAPRSAGRRYLPWAAVLIVGVLGAAGWMRFFAARDELSVRQRELAEARIQLATLVDQLDDSRRLGTLLVSAASVEIIPLGATDPAQPVPTVRVAYAPGSARAIAVLENAHAPEGHDYQLWALGPTGVRSLGVVTADAEGRALLDLALTESAETLQGFAISLEPPGGSPDPSAPSGPVIAVGTRA